MKPFTLAPDFRIASRLLVAAAFVIFSFADRAMHSAATNAKPAPKTTAAKGKAKSSAAKGAIQRGAFDESKRKKENRVKAVAGQTISGTAGVNYSFKLPAGLTLSTPARDKADNFTEFSASTSSAGTAGGEISHPFRFEAHVAHFEKPVDCAIFTQFSEGLTRTFMGDHYLDQSPAALAKVAGASFKVKVFHKEVPPDFNQKSAAINVAHYLTTQGEHILSLVFYTDARDEAKGQALRDAILKSLHLGAASGNAVCKSFSHSAAAPASSPAPSAAKPASIPK